MNFIQPKNLKELKNFREAQQPTATKKTKKQ